MAAVVAKPLMEAFESVVKTLGTGANKEQKDNARLQLQNAALRMELRDSEQEQTKLMERVNSYAVAANDKIEQTLGDVTGTTIAVSLTGGAIGFLAEAVAPSYFTNYPTAAKVGPYVLGALIAGASYVMTEPDPLERQQGKRPDLGARFNGIGFGVSMMGGAGLAQLGSTIATSILQAAQSGGNGGG